MKVKVSDYIVNRLAKEGINRVFGYQGGNISHLIDSIGNSSKIAFIENYNEQAAAFAANAYAQVHETVGVALASSGPGAINLINGIANAFCDSIPCLFLTGDVNTTAKKENGSARQNAFQEIDIIPIVKPIVKYCISIQKPEDIVDELDKAIDIAKEGRKGPVVINLPHDIQRSVIDIEPASTAVSMMHESYVEHLDEVCTLLNNAKKPLILVGGGMKSSKSRTLLYSLLEKYQVPVVSSLLGMDVLPHGHTCYRGVIGSYGNRIANFCLKYCDCLLVLGSRLDDRQISPVDASKVVEKKIIHVDVDAQEIALKLPVALAIVDSVDNFLSNLLQKSMRNKWAQLWCKKTADAAKIFADDIVDFPTHPNTFLRKLSQSVVANFSFDVGNNQMHAMQSVYINAGSNVLTSGGLGSMGYSLPAAIGASFAQPGKNVISITGDGGIQMNLQELQTIDYHNLPISIVLLNNNSLGMIKDLQSKLFSGRYYGTLLGYATPDFRKLAEVFHFNYIRVTDMVDCDMIIREIASGKRMFVELCYPSSAKPIPDTGNGIFDQAPMLSLQKAKELEDMLNYD